MKKTFKNSKGITLIALVITIIILLILAGISISALSQTGLFGKAKEAKQKSTNAQEEENITLGTYENEIDKYGGEKTENKDDDKPKEKFKGTTVAEAIKYGDVLNEKSNTELKDEKGNKIVVPAGFKITNDATTVDKGIVIEDATETATKGSQFVWIPVSKDDNDKITKADGTQFVNKLGRYDFDETTGAESAYSGSYVEEDANEPSTLKNITGKSIAKNITNFKNSVSTNGGYYIGRYEARTTTARSNKNDELTQITEKGTDQVYNYVTQQQAAKEAQGMYTSNNFTSDLMNSYAWDTATLFLQTCGADKYSIKTSVNTSLASKGTNASDYTGTRDNVCNVYDMSSNVREWTTETSNSSDRPCIHRGGNCDYSNFYTSIRGDGSISSSGGYFGFRPLLYL